MYKDLPCEFDIYNTQMIWNFGTLISHQLKKFHKICKTFNRFLREKMPHTQIEK